MTEPRILILTLTGDVHAYAVAEVLRHKGAAVEIWHTSDFPAMATESMEFSDGKVELSIQGPGLDLVRPELTAVWNRRKAFLIDEDALHEADRDFARHECHRFREGVYHLLSRQGFWVNPWKEGSLAENKPVQLKAALEVGLRIPKTLFTNDPERIRRFMNDHGGRIIYKGMRTRAWTDGERTWMPYVTPVEEGDLPTDETMQNAPGIYQELFAKAHELRVTVIGRQIFSAKVLSQETSLGKMDWRKSYGELTMEPHQLDPSVAQQCLDLMDRLGLVFGCFDFIVTPEGEHVFLEVNQMGQFLFVEIYSGLPLVDAFSELLLQGRADYAWDPDEPKMAYDEDLRALVRAASAKAKQRHAQLPHNAWQE